MSSPEPVQRLKANSVGLTGVIFMAVATAAPITAMVGNVPYMLGFGNGASTPGAYLIATAVLTIFAVGYVAMAKHITAAGAFYGYISHGLGRVFGLGSGLLAVLGYVVFEASIVGIFAAFADSLVNEQLGVDLHWGVYAALMIAITATLAHFDIHLTARVLGFFLATEILILGVLAVAILIRGGGPEGIPVAPINPVEAVSGVSGAAAGFGLFLAFWSWVGFESTAMYGEESRNPKKIIVPATLISVVGLGLFYAFVSWMVVAGNGPARAVELGAGATPFDVFFEPLRIFVGGWALPIFQLLMVTGSFACGMAFHQCASRYLYAVGREGLIWRGLGRTHPKHGSPHVASPVQTAITVLIVGLFAVFQQDPYGHLYVLMAILGTMALLLVQAICSFAVIAYFRRKPDPKDRPVLSTLVAPLIGGIAMCTVVYLMWDNLEGAAGAAASSPVFTAIPWIVGGVFLTGIAAALWARRFRPQTYEVMGRIVLEDTAERETSSPAPAEKVGV